MGTIVRMRSDYTMPGLLGKGMDWLVTRHAVVRRNQDYLARLKRYAESTAAGELPESGAVPPSRD